MPIPSGRNPSYKSGMLFDTWSLYLKTHKFYYQPIDGDVVETNIYLTVEEFLTKVSTMEDAGLAAVGVTSGKGFVEASLGNDILILRVFKSSHRSEEQYEITEAGVLQKEIKKFYSSDKDPVSRRKTSPDYFTTPILITFVVGLVFLGLGLIVMMFTVSQAYRIVFTLGFVFLIIPLAQIRYKQFRMKYEEAKREKAIKDRLRSG